MKPEQRGGRYNRCAISWLKGHQVGESGKGPKWRILCAGVLLVVTGLACETGEILTPEEATQRAQATRNSGGSIGIGEPRFGAGDRVQLFSSEAQVALHVAPGDPSVGTYIGQGEPATVEQFETYQNELWYLISSDRGEGWVRAEFLTRFAAAEDQGGDIEVGDSVYLRGQGFLVRFYEEAGGERIVSAQERGTLVTVLAIEDVEGKTWYRIRASAGTGWVPAEVVTTEKAVPTP